MKQVKFIIICMFMMLSINVFAQTSNTLIIKSHHPNDENTVIRIWKTPENNYIIRTTYSNKSDDFDQSKIHQYNKTVDYDGFAKRVTFKASETVYIIAYASGKYAFVVGFFSEALNRIVSADYIIDYINKDAFNNL